MQGVRFPLRIKLGAAAAALSAIPLAALGAVLLLGSRDVFLDAHKQIHLAVASEVYSAFDDGLRSAQDAIDATGRVITDGTVPGAARLGLARALVSGAEAIDHVAIYDAQGALIDVMVERDAEPPPAPRSLNPEWTARAMADGASVGSAVKDPLGVRLLVILPLRAAGELTGYAASWVSLARLQRQVGEDVGRIFDDQRYEIFLVNEELRYLVHSDTSKLLEAPEKVGVFKDLDPRTLRHRTEVMASFSDERGEHYRTLRTDPRRAIAVGVVVPAEVVNGPVARMFNQTVGFIFGAIIIGVLLSVLLARALTGPLAELAKFAQRLANRSFDERVDVNTGDELHLLGEAMNQAASDLAASEVRIREETAIRSDLGRYLPQEIVDKVVKREQDMALGGKRREVTILFADVVAFTPLTERLPAEEVVALLNELFTILTEIVFRHQGMVDKFIGDSVMAVFGSDDDPEEDHAERALAAAEDMVSWLEVGNAKWRDKHGVTIALAVGVNTGEVIVGNIGSSTRMEYTAIGEAVNLAARLESVARPQQILVGERTRALAGDAFPFREAGSHKLPGLEEPVVLFALEDA